MKQNSLSTIVLAALCCVCQGQAPLKSQAVGMFIQEVRINYTEADGLLDNDVRALAVCASGEVYAATRGGLCVYAQGKWQAVDALKGQAVFCVRSHAGPAGWKTGPKSL